MATLAPILIQGAAHQEDAEVHSHPKNKNHEEETHKIDVDAPKAHHSHGDDHAGENRQQIHYYQFRPPQKEDTGESDGRLGL